jgi:tripartite-type tricarboxylate transporter receptor subunit TctC
MTRLSATLAALAATLSTLALLAGSPARAAYPERTITIICASGAGGIVDVTARVIADNLSHTLNRSVVVQNEPGAGSTIAINTVAKAAPHGYTLLIIGPGLGVVGELYPKANVDVLRDLAPVSLVGDAPMVLLVHESVPGKDYPALIQYLKTHPSDATTGSNGRGSAGHLAISLFKKMADVSVQYIPYKTTPQAHTDLIGGRISMMMTSSMGDPDKLKMLRPVAVTSLERWNVMPDVPTLNELGLKGYEATTWVTMMGPKGLPDDIVAVLTAAVDKALADPELQKRYRNIGLVPPRATGPAALGTYLKQEVEKWADILRNTKD